MSYLSRSAGLAQIIDLAVCLVSNLVAVVLLQHGRKRPLKDRSGTWRTFDDPELVVDAITEQARVASCPNVGAVLHPKSDSHIIFVDSEDDSVFPLLRDLGLSRDDGSWRWRSGRGGLCALYFWAGESLPRRVRAGGLPLDLLANGYAILPPSDTYLFVGNRGRGGPYRWVKGHSPFDIPLAELESPPDALIEYWLSDASASPSDRSGETRATAEPQDRHSALDVVLSAIAGETRNVSLAEVAGWLRGKGANAAHIEVLLAALNGHVCVPPLDAGEVRAIALSIGRYSPGGDGYKRRPVVADFAEAS